MRKKVGDIIFMTNGKGLLVETKINLINKSNTELLIVKSKTFSPSKFKINIAIAPTKMNDRIEWFIEKATEIGINCISTIICEKSERKTIKLDRLDKIVISAMKQSLQYYKPYVKEIVTFNSFINDCKSDNKFIAHCKKVNKQHLSSYKLNSNSTTVLIGPEGGFTQKEIQKAEEKYLCLEICTSLEHLQTNSTSR
jgi:16S rRNA (uracil1498-N3)-methyltransferase